MPRIISGERKGRILKTLEGMHTRPTSDRVKESLFNILSPRLPCSTILDLFSGSGNLGLESLSRGADKVVFVENNNAALQILKENCRNLDYMQCTQILPWDVKQAIDYLSKQGMNFDIVFMDPPYDSGWEVPVVTALDTGRLVKDDGILIIEHLYKNWPSESIGSFYRYDIRKYGSTAISFYRKEAYL